MTPRRTEQQESWIKSNLGIIVQTAVIVGGGLLSLLKTYQALEARLITNEVAIQEIGKKHDDSFVVYKADVENLRDWLKRLSERTNQLELDMSHIKGRFGIPRSGSAEKSSGPEKSGDPKP